MKKNLLLLLFFLSLSVASLFAQSSISGHVYNDPDAGTTVTNNATPFSLPGDPLIVYLIKIPDETVTASVEVTSVGSFSFTSVPAGTYYLMLNTENIQVNSGDPAPFSLLETSWTRTGESVLPGAVADAVVDGKTNPITVSNSPITGIVFGIQERPSADNKMNDLFDNTITSPVPLSVNIGSAFTKGGASILSGIDPGGFSPGNYTISVLPKYGILYLGATAVISLADVSSLTPAQFATLAYMPNASALNKEQDIFTYYVTDMANSKSNNATYVIPFDLLDSDNDTYPNRVDLDDDNDGITDVNECQLNNFANLVASYPGGFSFIKPSHFGFDPTLPINRVGLNLTADISASFGKPAGSIIVTLTNANTHPSANEFYVNDSTGPTQWSISGSLGSYTSIEQGLEYFSYDTRTITLLNGTPNNYVLGQAQLNPAETNWYSGNDSYNWWLTNDNPRTYPNPSQGVLAIALTDPDPKHFQVAATTNNYQEWATYFVRILPECDYDNDGIPNRLDLDSDNDGCLDALEGSGAYNYSQVTNAEGTVSVGPGSSAQNQNLCASNSCVDSNGVPIIAGSNGQSVGSAYDKTTMSQVCMIAMPVRLISFNAVRNGNSAKLEWVTSLAQNNKGFEIERSMDGRNWEKIGFVNSQSVNSDARQDYNFTDNSPIKGYNYYRLKQLDFDGQYEHSKIRAVWFDNDNPITVYPNPATNVVNIGGLKGNVNIVIYDASGRLVHRQSNMGTTAQVAIDHFNHGTYYVQIISEHGTSTTQKIIKMK